MHCGISISYFVGRYRLSIREVLKGKVLLLLDWQWLEMLEYFHPKSQSWMNWMLRKYTGHINGYGMYLIPHETTVLKWLNCISPEHIIKHLFYICYMHNQRLSANNIVKVAKWSVFKVILKLPGTLIFLSFFSQVYVPLFLITFWLLSSHM